MQLALLLLGLNASAVTLPHFTPGAYDLVEGKVESCGQGPFEYLQNKTYVGFGAFHLFPLENKSEVLPADIPEEHGCEYRAKSAREVASKKSILNFEEIKACGTSVRHTLTKTAVVTRDGVTLDVAQKGNAEFGEQEPSYGFRCIWKLRSAARRGGASEAPKKTTAK